MKVLMVGPDIERVPGGMATVAKNYLESTLTRRINLKYLSSNIESSVLCKIFFNFKSLMKFIFMIPFYDIVHIHVAEKGSFYRKSLFVLITKTVHKKCILHFHGAEFEEFYYEWSTDKQRKYIRYILSNVDCIIALGEKWKSKIEKITHTPIFVLTNAVEVPKVNYYNSNNINLLLLGRLEKRKGTFDLLEVADYIFEEFPNVNLLLAGDGNLENVYQKVNMLRKKENVQVLGWVDKVKREQLLLNSGIFVLPSYNEGMPVAILEAMSYGLPVIVSNVGDIPTVIEDGVNGYIIKPGHKEELEKYIALLLKNQELRTQISKNNFEKIKKHYNLVKNVDSLHQIYCDLINN